MRNVILKAIWVKDEEYIDGGYIDGLESSDGRDIYDVLAEYFDEWYNDEIEHNRDLEEMYYGEEAIYFVHGALQQAKEQIEEIMQEYKIRSIGINDNRLDLTCAFM